MTTVSQIVAQRIRKVRKAKGMTVRAVAAACAERGMPELTSASLTNIERGHPDTQRGQRRVTVDDLYVLAAVLSVDPFQLLPGAPRVVARGFTQNSRWVS